MKFKSYLTKRNFLFFSFFILLAGGGYYLRQRAKTKVTSLKTITPTLRSVTQTLELSGEIKAHRQARLHFQTGGLVVYYPWHEGDTIKKFQTIASLDKRQLQKTLRQRLNLYAKQRNAFDQTQDNYRKNIDDGDIDLKLKRILENSQYDLNNSVINVELQDLSLQYATLFAPFTGILAQAPITTANVNVMPNDTFVLVDPHSLYFSAELEEGDLAKIKPDLPVKVSLDAFPNQTFTGKIDRIGFIPQQTSTGTVYPLEISFSQPPSALRLGLNGTAYLTLAHKEKVLALPQDVVYETDNGSYYVKILRNGKAVKQTVKVGLEGDDFVEIISGLDLHDQVIANE